MVVFEWFLVVCQSDAPRRCLAVVCSQVVVLIVGSSNKVPVGPLDGPSPRTKRVKRLILLQERPSGFCCGTLRKAEFPVSAKIKSLCIHEHSV